MEKKYLSKDLVGKQVVDANANIVGSVKDLSINMGSRTIALIITAKMGEDLILDSADIAAVGAVVLLKTEIPVSSPILEIAAPKSLPTAPQLPQPVTTPGLCGVCGYQNDSTSNFCIKCGTKLK